MYAVIKTGGKQYRVAKGQTLKVEQLSVDAGEVIDFEQVLMIADGDNITVGAPFIEGGKVSAKVKAHGRGNKIEVIKFKRRKQYRKQMGHRQNYTEVKVTGISAG